MGSHSFPSLHQHLLPSLGVQLELRGTGTAFALPLQNSFTARPVSRMWSRFSLPVAKVSSGGETSLKQEPQRKVFSSVQSAA